MNVSSAVRWANIHHTRRADSAAGIATITSCANLTATALPVFTEILQFTRIHACVMSGFRVKLRL